MLFKAALPLCSLALAAAAEPLYAMPRFLDGDDDDNSTVALTVEVSFDDDATFTAASWVALVDGDDAAVLNESLADIDDDRRRRRLDDHDEGEHSWYYDAPAGSYSLETHFAAGESFNTVVTAEAAHGDVVLAATESAGSAVLVAGDECADETAEADCTAVADCAWCEPFGSCSADAATAACLVDGDDDDDDVPDWLCDIVSTLPGCPTETGDDDDDDDTNTGLIVGLVVGGAVVAAAVAYAVRKSYLAETEEMGRQSRVELGQA